MLVFAFFLPPNFLFVPFPAFLSLLPSPWALCSTPILQHALFSQVGPFSPAFPIYIFIPTGKAEPLQSPEPSARLVLWLRGVWAQLEGSRAHTECLAQLIPLRSCQIGSLVASPGGSVCLEGFSSQTWPFWVLYFVQVHSMQIWAG